jgi:hypothetical protein
MAPDCASDEFVARPEATASRPSPSIDASIATINRLLRMADLLRTRRLCAPILLTVPKWKQMAAFRTVLARWEIIVK